jgi:hypothetical protein
LTMNELDQLNIKIKQSFSAKLHDAAWGQPQLMSKVLEEVCSVFDSPLDPAPKRSIGKTLVSFRRSEKLRSFLDLKYSCLGITQQIGEDDWRLIEDDKLFPVVLSRVDTEHKPRRFLKCYQGLLSGYFDYNIYADNVSPDGRKNWEILRSFLCNRLSKAQQVQPAPSWVTIISKHANLLSEDLCDNYGTALAQGDYRELKSVLEGLLIPRNSWVWEATVLSRIKAICVLDDDTFKKHLDQCLDMISQKSKMALSEIQKKRCIAQLVSRYAKCSSRPEHTALLESAVVLIGNPLINRAAWDAFVLDEEAHGMINRWFKRRLITDFFRILSGDGPADSRRIQYWLRFESSIDDMWFALGPYAYKHPGEDFREFRKIAQDRILLLENGDMDINNALILRIDEYVFVELSATGHTCLVFKYNELPFDLDKKWIYIGSKPSEKEYLSGKQRLKFINY